MNPKTMQEALALVPEYIMLKPGSQWREGDEELKQSTLGSRWIEPFTIRDAMLAYLKIEGHQIARRPIPQSVRESEARWILYNSLATVDPINFGWIFALEAEYDEEGYVVAGHRFKKSDLNFGMRKFPSKESAEAALKIFNTYQDGQSDLIEMLSSGPGALWRWIMESHQ